MATKSTTNRFNDYIYDPLFVVSGEKDYYKAAMTAKLSSAKFAICPIFPSMFSDLPHKPRQQYIMRRSEPIPEYKSHTSSMNILDSKARPVDVVGFDRHKFFSSPIVVPEMEMPKQKLTPPPTPVVKPKMRNKKMQTQYRESSAQTIPWQPDYVVIDNSEPELLMLDFLKWGSGLPAGMHEVRLIERARMKRAWEKALPPASDPASLAKRRQLIEAMERDEWAFREQEIQDIHDLRFELLVEMLNELLEKSKTRTEQRLKMYADMKIAEKEAKLKVLRHKTERELRKLDMKQRGYMSKYHKVNIVDEHVDRKSELYAPLMRHGEHPKRWHQVISDHIKKYRAQYLGVEEISTWPRWLDPMKKIKDDTNIKLPGTRICIRESKWTAPVLKKLHEELKNLRKEDKRQCTLMVRVTKDESEILTPQVDSGDDWEEEIHQAAVLIESVLRGRASQILIFEGRDRCRELIEELRSTHALQEEDKIKKFHERLEVKSQQREHVLCTKNTKKVLETLNKLSGNVVGTLLDFLNKELRRLLDERRAHAMCLLFERERHSREAAEAGRRQTELRRRLEHDEMFKQVVKVHQDTVDLYLQDIITEGLDFASNEEARLYVESMAKKIDDAAYSKMNELEFQEKEEIIAGLVHNFLLPEVEKQMVRHKIKQRQHNYLKTAHNAIYNKMEDLPTPYPHIPEHQTISTTSSDITNIEKPMVAKARAFEQGEILERSVWLGTFSDLDLPETQELNVIYAPVARGFSMERQSEVSAIMAPMMQEVLEDRGSTNYDDVYAALYAAEEPATTTTIVEEIASTVADDIQEPPPAKTQEIQPAETQEIPPVEASEAAQEEDKTVII